MTNGSKVKLLGFYIQGEDDEGGVPVAQISVSDLCGWFCC